MPGDYHVRVKFKMTTFSCISGFSLLLWWGNLPCLWWN